MCNDLYVDENKRMYFLYADAKGHVGPHILFVTHIGDDYIEGRSITKNAFRRYLKNRILKTYSSEELLFNDGGEINELKKQLDDNLSSITSSIEIAFVGLSSSERKKNEKIAKENNFIVRSGVAKNLSFLCIGSSATDKLRPIIEASERNIPIITIKQFLELINTGEIPHPDTIDGIIRRAVADDEEEYRREMIEDCELKFGTIRGERRGRSLLAIFRDGFAVGWSFAVRESFKDALDIKLTTIQRNKKSISLWTQGSSFSFNRGDVFYSDEIGYTDWGAFLKLPHAIALTVKHEVYSGYELSSVMEGVFNGEYTPAKYKKPLNMNDVKLVAEFQTYDHGKVVIDVMVPNKEKNKIESVKELVMTQDELVSLLQTGYYIDNQDDGYKRVNIFDIK